MDIIEAERAQIRAATEHPYEIIPIPSCATLNKLPQLIGISHRLQSRRAQAVRAEFPCSHTSEEIFVYLKQIHRPHEIFTNSKENIGVYAILTL